MLTSGMKVFLVIWAVASAIALIGLTVLVTLIVLNEMEYQKHEKDDEILIRMVNNRGA